LKTCKININLRNWRKKFETKKEMKNIMGHNPVNTIEYSKPLEEN
jgi:hypothetical protein